MKPYGTNGARAHCSACGKRENAAAKGRARAENRQAPAQNEAENLADVIEEACADYEECAVPDTDPCEELAGLLSGPWAMSVRHKMWKEGDPYPESRRWLFGDPAPVEERVNQETGETELFHVATAKWRTER